MDQRFDALSRHIEFGLGQSARQIALGRIEAMETG